MSVSAAGGWRRALATLLALAGLAGCAPGGDTIPVNGKTTSTTSGGPVPLTLVPPTLSAWLDQSGRFSTVRTVKLQAFGGAPNAAYTWAISKATPLPFSTLALDGATGIFSGNLPADASLGRFNFNVDVSDGVTTVSDQVSLIVASCRSLTTGGISDKTQCHAGEAPSVSGGAAGDLNLLMYANSTLSFPKNQLFGFSLFVAGGVTPFHNWKVVSGSLPPGVQLDSSNGFVWGTPSSAVSGNTYTFAVGVTDSNGVTVPGTTGGGAQSTLLIGN